MKQKAFFILFKDYNLKKKLKLADTSFNNNAEDCKDKRI